MSAAVSVMQSQPGAGSNPGSRMGTHSPIDNKHNLNIKNEGMSIYIHLAPLSYVSIAIMIHSALPSLCITSRLNCNSLLLKLYPTYCSTLPTQIGFYGFQ
jgi:hypothetical protein